MTRLTEEERLRRASAARKAEAQGVRRDIIQDRLNRGQPVSKSEVSASGRRPLSTSTVTDPSYKPESVKVDPKYTRSRGAGPVQPSREALSYTESAARQVVPEKLPPKTLMQRGASGLRALGRGAVSPWNAVIAGVLPYDTATQEQEDAHRAAMTGRSYWDTPTGMRAQAAVPGTVGPIAPSQQELTRRDYTRPGEEATVPQIQPEGLTRDPTYFGDDYLQNIKDPGLRRTIAADAYRRGAVQDPVEQARIEAMPPEDRPQGLASDMTAEDAYRRNRLKGMRAALRKTDPELANKLDAQDRTAASATRTAQKEKRTQRRQTLGDMQKRQDKTLSLLTDYFKAQDNSNPPLAAAAVHNKYKDYVKFSGNLNAPQDVLVLESIRKKLARAAGDATTSFDWIPGMVSTFNTEDPVSMMQTLSPIVEGLSAAEIEPGDAITIGEQKIPIKALKKEMKDAKINISELMTAAGYTRSKKGGWDLPPGGYNLFRQIEADATARIRR